jgi:lipoprotein NlpD
VAIDAFGPLARSVFAGLVLLVMSGCLSLGKPVVSDRSGKVDDPPPRTAADEPPVIPTPGRTRSSPPPVVSISTPGQTTSKRSPPATSYLVRRGDTLYSIAYRFDLDPRGFARANAIAPPYTIYPGQSLELVTARRNNPAPSTSRSASPPSVPPPSVRRPSVTRTGTKGWVWPLSVAPSTEFGTAGKGMDFNIATAQSLKCVSAGQVVYAGGGIGGFARLIIVRHTDSLLSAYSFNGEAQVEEQQVVNAGDTLADIAPRGRLQEKLHFEIRKNGEPVNPRSVIN